MVVADARTELLRAELAEVRDELRRIDGKARDLLVVATLAVTVAAAAGGLVAPRPPPLALLGFVIAIVPWFASVTLLLLVIRPMRVPERAGPFSGRGDPARAGEAVEEWLSRRWQALARIVNLKYRRVRQAVDLLFVVVALATVSGLAWPVTVLFG